jgi:prepilin-type N-terminal cleavage/methylation domain-containing protein
MQPHFPRTHRQPLAAAFTLPEMMVVSSIFLLLITGVIIAQVGGLKMFSLVRAKVGANADARQVLGELVKEVRSAKIIRVGNATASSNSVSFTPFALGQRQQGNSLQLHLTTNTNNYVVYYLNPASSKLLRKTDSGPARVVAEYVTNQTVFTAENYQGQVLSNNQNNRVIGVALQFYQVQYPITAIGSAGAYFDFYQLRTKVTRRVLE